MGLLISRSSLLLARVSLIHFCIHMDTELVMKSDVPPPSVLLSKRNTVLNLKGVWVGKGNRILEPGRCATDSLHLSLSLSPLSSLFSLLHPTLWINKECCYLVLPPTEQFQPHQTPQKFRVHRKHSFSFSSKQCKSSSKHNSDLHVNTTTLASSLHSELK